MRKIGLMALLVVAAMGFARQSNAAQINLEFTTLNNADYVVTAVADVDWTTVNFGMPTATSGVFTANTANFALTATFTSAGIVGRQLDQGVIGPCPGTGCFASAATISVGNFVGALTAGGPFQLISPLTGGGTTGVVSAAPIFGVGQNGLDGAGNPIDVFVKVTLVPEPTTVALLGVSLAGLAFLRRRTA